MITLHWNGQDLPDALRDLPPGTYIVEPLGPAPLSLADEDGLHRALAALRAGNGRSLLEVQETVAGLLSRREQTP
jgi:hypothetical protein